LQPNQIAELTLKNGSMEQGDAMPLGWQKGAAVPGVEYVWDKAVGHDSQASLRLHKTVQRYFPIAQWHQFVPNAGNASKLKVSAWVKAEKATKGIVDILFFGQGGKMTHQWIAYIGAKNANEPPVSHDWKEYTGVAEIPPGTTRLGVALQIYGPGKIWFDDVRTEFVSDETPQAKGRPLDDIADIPSQDLTVDGNDRMRYFLVGPKKGAVAPDSGFKLVVVMPGGDGSEDFHPFVRRLYKYAMNDEFLVAQPVAVNWRPLQKTVWPTLVNPVEGQEFSTEDFVEAVIRDVAVRHSLDKRCVFTLSWSSGGPAAYALALKKETPVKGSYVAMSVYRPQWHPPVANAKGRLFLLDHSPEDRICRYHYAKQAKRELSEAGATVRLVTYKGGHGWHGRVYDRVREGLSWLVRQAEERGR
jgi:predicted esterase